MKTENYKIAIDKIHNTVGQAVVQQIPTLDHIMGVKNMSPTDKIWYDAYKKYGNRNHTWHDFRDMFYDDLTVMQNTVKHWKTWDEINNLLSRADELKTEVKKLLSKYNVESISEDKEEYKQYRILYPDLIAAYKEFLSLNDMANPNYSTYSPEIAKLEKEFETKSKSLSPDNKKSQIDLVVEYITKMDEYIDLKNGDFVVGERIEIYRKIIFNNSQILQKIRKFDKLSGSEKVDLARMILNESAKITGTPTGRVIHDDAPNGPHILQANQGGGYSNTHDIFLFKDKSISFSSLGSYLKTLAHEDAHRIDYYNAEYGMVGTQLMKFVENNYLNNSDIDEELYKKWATEQSSYYLDKTTCAALKYMTENQNA